jgi:chromosome segregation ATPase
MAAMSEEHTRNLEDHRSFEERVFASFDAMDARFDAIDTRFDAIDTRFEKVESRLEALELRSEKRDLETKPIWERALAEILEVKNGLGELSRKFDVLSRDVVNVRADQLRLDDRLDKLEAKPS